MLKEQRHLLRTMAFSGLEMLLRSVGTPILLRGGNLLTVRGIADFDELC